MKNFLRKIGLFRLVDKLREKYLAIPFIMAALTLTNSLQAATFPVTNTNDAGPGSLRQAILDVNAAGPGPHNIVFNVYGQITLLTSLPQITKSDLTVDGETRITLNSNGTNPIINPFDIGANNVTIRNFSLTNNGDVYFVVRPNTTGVLIENITTSSTTGNWLNSLVYVAGASANLTLRKITSTDLEPCGGAYPYSLGRAFIFTGGVQTNLVMDSITLSTPNNARGCEAVVFRDASVNGWTFTNSNISGFSNGIVLDNTGGPVETANNILLNKITLDSLYSGVALGFYSDFVNTNIQLKNTIIDLDVVTSPDDGDYPIRFDNTTNGITLDSVIVKDADIYSIWFNGAAQNITINHTTVTDPTPGHGYNGQFLRFETTASAIVIKNTLLDADKTGSTDDADYGLLLVGATNGVTMDSCTFNEFDVDGVYLAAANTNLQISNSKFTSNLDGIEFYNNVPRSNVDIINSLFKGSTRSGIVMNAANAVSDIDLTGDTVIENTNHGIWLHGGTAPTDVLISGCVVANNGGAGIRNDDPDKVVYTNNSIYNNTLLGIDNVAGNCGYQNPASVPTIVSSTPLGGGQYELVISLPALAGSGYTVDLYANDPATSASSGQYFVTSLTGLNSGSNTRTVTYNTGPGATGAGFWTATLRLPANNCGTSEFSNKLAIATQGPGNVDANVKLWLRADAGLTNLTSVPNTEGQMVNRWSDFSQGGAPNAVTSFGTVTYKKAGINFNPAGYFAGAIMQAGGDGSTWLNSANITSIAVFNKYTTAADGSRVFVVYDNASGGYDYTTNAESIIFGRVGANIQTHRGQAWENPVIPNAIGRPGLFTSITNAAAHAMYYNGTSQGAAAYNKGNINAEQWFLGGGYANGWCCGTIADIAEVVTFDRELSVPELGRVHSYLAIKYGLTLPGNYVASDGTTIPWNATANAGYLKHITGIGRDDSTFLYQKQSLSADTGIVTLALGDNIAADNASNAAAIGTNKSFLVFGDNGAAATYTTAASGTYINQRMARVWKVQKTNWTDQNITLRVTGAGSSNYLIISSDPSFATISQELPLNSAGTVTISSAMLTDGIYFTIGASIKGPACVTTGIGVWLRADDNGANGAIWGDFSGLGNGAVQTNAARQATVLPAGVNFNPALKFDGINDFLTTPSMFTATGTNNIQVYAVAITDNLQNQDLFGELVSNGQHVHAHLPWSDGILYWDAPYGYRAQGAWGGTTGAPYLWSLLRSPSSMNASRNRTQVAVYNAAMGNIAASNNPFGVGALGNGVQPFNGKIAELIVYNNSSTITATQRQQIESYLAIKYGLTLSPAVPVDYLASDGATKIWDAAVNTGYKWHITGIGRDSCTGLYQKQSRSADTGYVTVALGNSIAASNAANSGSIANNISFFVISDNGAAATFTNAVTGLDGVGVRLGRTWKVQKTNWDDQDITLVTDSTITAPQYLIISTDANFGAGDLVLPVSGRSITLNTSQFANGAFFTFGNGLKAPGNVTAGIAAWWRADVNASATSWDDFSGNGKTLTQASVPNRPSVLPVNVNYQPAVKFGPTGWVTSASLFGTASTNNIAIFAVSAADGAGNGGVGSGLFSEYVSNGGQISAWAPYGNGHIYWYPPNGWNVVSTTPLIAYANPRFNLLGFTKTPAQLNIYFNNAVVGTANGAYTGINGNNQPFYLGAFNGPDWFNGRIAEFVVYNNSSAMTATDRQKIQSYLALKYGITLNPAAPVDYLASDGTNMWSATDNAGYQRRITGLGRDDSSALYQRQSLSIDTGIVAIAAGSTFAISNAANTSVIDQNKSFLVFGDNGASASYLAPVTGITDVNTRMNRIFKLDKTNWTDQDITLKLKGGNAQTRLLVSADANFGAGDAAYPFTDSTLTINSSNLPDGAYFTFALAVRGPNAVNNGVVLWLRADDGEASGALWRDFSGNAITATQDNSALQPFTDAKALNFNYGLKFDGANDYLLVPNSEINGTFPFANTDRTLIGVASKPGGVLGTVFSYGHNTAGTGNGLYVSAAQQPNYFGWGSDLVGAANTFRINAPMILTGRHINAGGTNTFLDLNGANIASGAFTWNTNSTRELRLGIDPNNSQYWPGYTAEIIVYNRVLNATELQKVNSYLSLKYGITMNAGAQDYLAADGTTYWTNDATYKWRITGIGRDDSTILNTKQSLSADTGFVTLSLGNSVALTNEQNGNTITNNRSFLVFADNGLSSNNFTVQVTGSVNVTRRMARVWKVQKTNWADQDITLKIKPIGIDNYLLISSDANFATLSQQLPVGSDGTVVLSSSLFTGTDLYFTFGAPLKSPGGVPGHALWVRADIGTSSTINNTAIDEWTDLSAMANSPKQATAAAQPLFLDNTTANINFNPVVDFDGTADRMQANSVWGTSQVRNLAIFSVANSEVVGQNTLFSELTTSTDRVQAFVPWSDGITYWDAPYGERVSTAWGGTYGMPYMWTFVRSNPATNTFLSFYRNHRSLASALVPNASWPVYNGNNSPFYIGARDVGSYFNGKIPEMIVYNADSLAPGSRLKIASYLGIKYGITIDQTSPANYLATDSTVIWDATANVAYKNNIAGIGRDDEEALQQKQSRSINTGLQLTIGLGSIDSTNMANTNSFDNDRSYLLWGDDGAATNFRTAVSGHAIVNYRMARLWKVQETGTVGTVLVAIPYNALPNSADAHLIVSADATLDGSDNFYPLNQIITINGLKHFAATVDMANGQYFSFGTDVKAPGGVVGTSLWLRPDYGTSSTTDNTTIGEWIDFAAEVNNANQATAVSQPLYRNNTTNNINFNPVVTFNGSNQFMNLDITRLPMGTSARTLIAVANPVAIAGTNKYIISWGQSATSQGSALGSYTNGAGVFVGYGDDLATAVNFWQLNRPNQLMNVWAGAGGNANIYSKGLQVAGPVVKNWNTIGTVARIGNSSFAATQPEYWNGSISDVIVYPFALNAGQRLKVETYLSIRNGYTIDQTLPNNYLATDSSIIWDATVNSVYKNNIAGIGRDDAEGLEQKQSRSINTGMQPAIGLAALDSSNLSNANAFAADKSYLVWGDDNGAQTFKTAVTGSSLVNYRMSRVWKVQETGTIADVELAVPFDVLPNPTQSYLAVSNDAIFDGTDTYIPLYDITLVGKKHWAAKVNFTTGQYFTIASFIKSPGGVGATSLWVRSDHGIQNNTDGSAVDLWVDFGNEVNNASQATATNQPVFSNNATDNINYNPVVKFNGTAHFMNLDVSKLPTGTTARTIIGVAKPDNVTSARYLINWGASANSQGTGLALNTGIGYMVGYSDDIFTANNFWQINIPNELFGTWAGSGGQANLYSKMLSVTTPVNKSWNTGTAAGARLGTAYFGPHFWSGPVTEVIAFDRALNLNDRQRVSTYLAIRNGYTIDQTVPVDYLNTNSRVIWNATANATYKNNIAGIGRDDIEGLNQKQSKSIHPGAIVAIGLGALGTDNLANNNNFVGDTSYLVWGSNSTALTVMNSDLPAVFNSRITQEWKVSLSNFDNQLSSVAMEFDLTGIAHGGTDASHFTLLIDNDGDGDFTTGVITEVAATDFAGGKASFSSVTALTNGAVFTVAIGPKSLQLITKVILQGAWNGSAMRTDLKTAGVLPATDPYGQATTPAVSPTAASAQVVDWILVELRDANNPASIIDTRAALLLADGNVVDTGYAQPLRFYNASASSYIVTIRHRNHLGVMSLNAVDFSTGIGTIDFTANATATFGSHAQKDLGSGTMGLWAGNVNGDNSIRHSAKPSDGSAVATAVMTHTGNAGSNPAYTGFNNVYSIYDVNLDGRVYYKALPSDQAIITGNVTGHPGNTFGLTSYIIKEQLP